MYNMIKRQTARFLFRPIPGPDRVFMAAASSSSSSSSLLLGGRRSSTATNAAADPFFFKAFHCSPTPSPSHAKLPIHTCNGLLTLKGCSSDPRKKSVDFNNNNSVPKARAFDLAPCPPLLLRHLEIGLEEGNSNSNNNNKDAKLPNGLGAYEHGSPLGFPDHSLPEKIVVAVDVDEVLGNFISALNRFISDRYSLNHSVSEYHCYEFFKIWNCSRDEADLRVHEFFKTSYFKTGIHPIPGARQALHKLSRFCNLSVVTSRQNAIKDHTIEWIENHYPRLFQEIHFGNHFALDGESRPKSDICRSLGAKVLIDDNPRYALECAEIGIRVLLFDYENSYPWCKSDSIIKHPLVTKVHNWDEVEQQLVSWIVS